MNWSDYFEYKDDGILIRISQNNGHEHVGWINNSGYLQTETVFGTFMVHRIIYEMHYGAIPEGFYIDHIDRNPLNNKIENLRAVNPSLSKINTGKPKNNTSGYKGVLSTPSGKFQARLGYKGKKLYIGLYATAEEAAEAVKLKSIELYGEFTA